MHNNNHKSTNNRKWFAMIRLCSYAWLLVLSYLVLHYEPEYRWAIWPAINTLYAAIGACVGRYWYMFRGILGGKSNGR